VSKKVQVVVIGGGATGTGVLRDLALRGIDSLLIEQNDLATGTSGRFHGLLHSGARYVVKDLNSAKECIKENQILKKIAPSCIENTGGMFISTKEDNPDYITRWLEGCKEAGITTKEISPAEIIKQEPAITTEIRKAYLVPDAAVDGFTLAAANLHSAKKAGAKAKTYTKVINIILEKNKVNGVVIRDKITGNEDYIKCDFVINAAGAWAGQLAKLAGQSIKIFPDKGVLVIFNHRITDKILNRLRPPGDGDIFVPHSNVTIFGTTSKKVNCPDDTEVTTEEVLNLLDQGSQLIPSLKDMRLIRAFAGVRPLYQPNGTATGRSATRDFALINHQELTGLEGFISLVGGKLTTYRLMAKAAVDFVAKQLKVDKPCITHKEMIYAPIIKQESNHKSRLCQCEMVTKEMLDQAVKDKNKFTLGDVRRLTRLGMGPCQGTFCTFRAAGYYHESKGIDAMKINKLLKDDIQERWKGSKPILWGRQAQEMELTRGIYMGLLNLDRLDCERDDL
jgi:glycerol-3-phosphate dehydrogenase